MPPPELPRPIITPQGCALVAARILTPLWITAEMTIGNALYKSRYPQVAERTPLLTSRRVAVTLLADAVRTTSLVLGISSLAGNNVPGACLAASAYLLTGVLQNGYFNEVTGCVAQAIRADSRRTR